MRTWEILPEKYRAQENKEVNFWTCWCLGHVIIPMPNFFTCALSHGSPGELLCFPALHPQSEEGHTGPQGLPPPPPPRPRGGALEPASPRGEAGFPPAAHAGRPRAWRHICRVPDLAERFLPGMQTCFSHPSISSLFIPTVVAAEKKVMYRKAIFWAI